VEAINLPRLRGGAAQLVDGGGEVGGEGLLGCFSQLGALAGQVEDIDGGFAFGVDESYLDVALVKAEGDGDLAKQAGEILSDHLQNRRVGGGFGVELKSCGHLDFEVGWVVTVAAGFEHLLDGDCERDHVVEIDEEAVLLAGVEFEGVEDVGEVEAVNHHAGFVGEGAGFDDVHAPGGQGASHVGKEA